MRAAGRAAPSLLPPCPARRALSDAALTPSLSRSAFIFPAWFHAALVAGPAGRRTEVLVDYAIVAIGVGILVFSTVIALQTWSTSTFNACIAG